jgi:hypothetical protein
MERLDDCLRGIYLLLPPVEDCGVLTSGFGQRSRRFRGLGGSIGIGPIVERGFEPVAELVDIRRGIACTLSADTCQIAREPTAGAGSTGPGARRRVDRPGRAPLPAVRRVCAEHDIRCRPAPSNTRAVPGTGPRCRAVRRRVG